MAKRAPGAAGLFKSGGTGRYVDCPLNGLKHAPFAKQVERSDKGNLWFRCVCGFRGYFTKDVEEALNRMMTKQQAIATGRLIPDELT